MNSAKPLIGKQMMAFCLALVTASCSPGFCQQAQSSASSTVQLSARPETDDKFDEKKAHAAFAKLMSGSKLVGNFTVVGAEKRDLTAEEYTISKVEKMEEGDYWKFHTRIKYLQYDVKVAIPLQVKWAGDTPVITVEGEEIPVLGKFNARVVIHENKYSGTWSHGDHGGHLFGVIRRADDSNPEAEDKSQARGDQSDKIDKSSKTAVDK